MFAELWYARKIIKDVLGVTTQCWRPPYGDVDNRVRAFAEGLNLTTIIWDEDSADWTLTSDASGTSALPTVDANYESFVSMGENHQWPQTNTAGQVEAGPVVLSHELADITLDTLMSWYPKIRSAYAHVVDIATAYNWTHPYVEQNYTYPDFNTYIMGLTGVNVTSGVTSTAPPASGSTSAAASASGSGSATSGPARMTGSSSAAATGAGTDKSKSGSGNQNAAKSGAGRVARAGGAGLVLAGLGAALLL